MPAIVAHHLFGMQVYDACCNSIGLQDAARQAFLLGNQGPDPLFCLKIVPASTQYNKLGWLMHSQQPANLLYAVHKHFVQAADVAPAQAQQLRAYGMGMLCHYLLDSTAHPLIYAQEYALCDAGVPGLTRTNGARETHALIEADLDEYLLAHQMGVTVNEFVPHLQALQCSGAVLVALSQTLARVGHDVYGLPVPPWALYLSVRMYRAGQYVLDSKRGGLRGMVDYARLAGSGYRHICALTHQGVLRYETPFANDQHIAWPHPYLQGETITSSFGELYAQTKERASRLVPAFAQPGFSLQDCKDITGNVNFNGSCAQE